MTKARARRSRAKSLIMSASLTYMRASSARLARLSHSFHRYCRRRSLCSADPPATTPGRLLCSKMHSAKPCQETPCTATRSMFPARWLRERKCRYLWCIQAIRILYTSQLTYSHIIITVLPAYPSIHDCMRVALLPELCPPSSYIIPRIWCNQCRGAHKQILQPIHST